MVIEDKINELKKEYDILKNQVADVNLMSDKKKFKKISRRFSELNEIIMKYNQITDIEEKIYETRELLDNELEREMQILAKEEIETLGRILEEASEELKDLLTPKDPLDEKNVIVEIRAGTGGEEAGLFVSDLYRMYSYLAEQKKWKLSIISSNQTGIGGLKEIIFSLEGDDVYGTMKFESGVHRVQRVPVTESSGRIHTSAVTVAVLPEIDDIEVSVDEADLRVDVYRSSGHGGQSVNTTDSAVRITHIPTGIVVTCQDEKSQLKNKVKALKVLKAKLYDMELAKQQEEVSKQRKLQVSTGDRSAKIRTYNFAQSRVTDHRINLNSYRLEAVLNGDLNEFIENLKIVHKNEIAYS